MGFKPQLQQIYEFIHQNQIELQILFFSATYQENVFNKNQSISSID